MALGFLLENNVGMPDSTRVIPDKTLSKNVTPSVLTVSFGDGYEQRIVEGINNIKEEYTVSFNNRQRKEIDAIVETFNIRAGVTKFDFTIPATSQDANGNLAENTIKVVCSQWSQTYAQGEFYTCNATFRRVYES